jgi:hypothetical protein
VVAGARALLRRRRRDHQAYRYCDRRRRSHRRLPFTAQASEHAFGASSRQPRHRRRRRRRRRRRLTRSCRWHNW